MKTKDPAQILSRRLIIFFWIPLLGAAQNSSLRGVAANALSHQPIARVHIRLLKVSSQMAGDVYGAMSDDAGHFSIANISPGAYYVLPEHAGFVATPPAKNPRAYAGVTLKAGENITDFGVELTPAAVIRGRVVDEYGDPVARASVQIEPDSDNSPAFNLGSSGPFRRLIGPGGVFLVQANDRGEFVATGLPGKYYVSASSSRGPRPATRKEIRTDGTTDAVYTKTYFPNAGSKEGATSIEVKPAEDTHPIEIRMRRQPNLSISGVVSGLPAGARPRIALSQTASPDGSAGSRFSFTTPGDQDGHFSFGWLPPGSYRLFATFENKETALQSPIQSLSISNVDVSGVVLPLTELGEIAGAVEVAGSKALLRGTIRLTSSELSPFEGVRSSVPLEKDGSFHITHVAAAHHEIAIDPLPDNAFIESVIVDGVAHAGSTGFKISSGGRTAELKIIVNLNGGQLSGTIVDRNGSIITGGTSTVYLAEDPTDMSRARSTRVKEDGSYLIQGIRPGRYHLFATDLFRSPGARDRGPRDQGALGQLAGLAEEIDIQAGDRLTKKLTPLSQEDANAKPRP